MDYSVWCALAKSEHFVWFLILVVAVVGLCWIHYQRVLQDLLCSEKTDVSVIKPKD
ncbi:hypothetical protein KAR34_01840 [bacterium]|nr:hypothetical protein [bacterium]